VLGSRTSAYGRVSLARVCKIALTVLLTALVIVRPDGGIAGAEYIYDDLGRIVQAANSDGSVTLYRYDANGNLTRIERTNGSALSITSLTPLATFAGQSVTISGTGFSATPGQNAVTVGGVTATVTSASPTMLVISVPAAAATGVVSVTVAGTTATSTDTLVILRPTITNFSPRVVAPGALVTLTGTNLNLVAGSTTISVGGVPVTVNSLTNAQAVFVAPGTLHSGRVTVNTAYGSITSSSTLMLPPSSISVANVLDSATLSPDAQSYVNLNIAQPNKFGVLAFEGTAGQYVSLQFNPFTTVPSGRGFSYQVFTPSNTLLTNQTMFNTHVSIHLPVLPATGTYLVAFSSDGTGQLAGRLEVNPVLALDAPVPVALSVLNQTKRYVFTASAGQTVAVSATNVITNPANRVAGVNVFNASGTRIRNNGSADPIGFSVNADNLAAGIYTAVVGLPVDVTASLQLTLRSMFGGILPVNGVTTTFSGSAPGQNGYFTFSANAGQSFGLGITSFSFAPSGVRANFGVTSPSGALVGAFECVVPSCQFSLFRMPVTGTYRISMEPVERGSMTVSLTLSEDLTGTLTTGTPRNVTLTLPGQNSLLTFTAAANQRYALNVSSVSLSPPDKKAWAGLYDPSDMLVKWVGAEANVPATYNTQALSAGTYSVLVAPAAAATGSAQITVVPQVGGAIVIDGATRPYNSTVPGENGYFTFAGTAGQNLGVGITNIASVPSSNTTVDFNVLKPDNGLLVNWSCEPPGCSGPLLNLPVTGTYAITMTTTAAGAYRTVSFGLTMSEDVAGTLVAGAPQSISLSVPGQQAVLTFTATQGQSVTVTASSVATTPANTNVSVRVLNAAGTQVGAATARTGVNGIITLTNLAAGNYRVHAIPAAAATATLQVAIQ
jgi:YD repeat-containing protein